MYCCVKFFSREYLVQDFNHIIQVKSIGTRPVEHLIFVSGGYGSIISKTVNNVLP